MSWKGYKSESKKNWGTHSEESLRLDQINTGALLRIADASEAMAKSHNRLIAENEFLVDHNQSLMSQIDTLRRSNAALKGVITRMKKKTKVAE